MKLFKVKLKIHFNFKQLLYIFFANKTFSHFHCNFYITCSSYQTNSNSVQNRRMTINEYNQAVDNFSDQLYRFVLKSCRDSHKAEDIVQDSYEKLWKNVDNVNAEKVKSYLFTTAYHTLIDRIRKEKRSSFSEELNLKEQSHENNYSDLNEVLKEAVNRLPELQRMVLLLRDYEGYSYKEIGEIAKLSEPQVKVYIYRARVSLKKYIGKIDVLV